MTNLPEDIVELVKVHDDLYFYTTRDNGNSSLWLHDKNERYKIATQYSNENRSISKWLYKVLDRSSKRRSRIKTQIAELNSESKDLDLLIDDLTSACDIESHKIGPL